jgi:hypothetical protein
MIGLTAIIVIGVLLALALWAYAWAYRLARRKGKSEAAAFGWGIGAVFLFSLPITWDAIPTWIAFWAAAGFIDTLLRCEMKPEVVYANEKEIQPRVQA